MPHVSTIILLAALAAASGIPTGKATATPMSAPAPVAAAADLAPFDNRHDSVKLDPRNDLLVADAHDDLAVVH